MAEPINSDARIRKLEKQIDVVDGFREMLREWRGVKYRFKNKTKIGDCTAEDAALMGQSVPMTDDELREKDASVDAGECWLAELERAIELKCPKMAVNATISLSNLNQSMTVFYRFNVPFAHRGLIAEESRAKATHNKNKNASINADADKVEIRRRYPIKKAELKAKLKHRAPTQTDIIHAIAADMDCSESKVEKALRNSSVNR